MNFNDELLEASVLDLNRNAMSLLRDQQFSKALQSLKKATKAIEGVGQPEKRLKLEGITLNNLGCFYKRTKKPNVALRYLAKACEQEEIAAVDNVNLAGTHLNMCAIFSDLGKHELALEQGLKSLELMKTSKGNSPNLISTLVIAYHNTGVEYEFLNLYDEALDFYKVAWETAEKYLGNQHPLTVSMGADYSNLDKKKQEKDMRNTIRDGIKKEPVPKLSKSRFKSAGKRTESKGENSEKYGLRTGSIGKKIFKPVVDAKKFRHLSEATTDLGKTRFLTGERLQPMFKNHFRVKSQPRGSIKENKVNSGDRFSTALPLKKYVITEDLKNIDEQLQILTKVPKKPQLASSKKIIEKMLFRHHQESAALKIQKNFRGYHTRKHLKSKNLFQESSEKTEFDLFLELENLKFQTDPQKPIREDLFSPLEVIPEIPDNFSPDRKINPLPQLQAAMKGYLVRKNLKNLNSAAIIIQKAVRCHQCHIIYKSILEAVVCIQSFYRGYSVRKSLIIT